MNRLFVGFLLLFVGANALIAASGEEQYLENKRRQLELQTRQAREAKQALEAYKSSFDALQKRKMQALIQKEADINATLARIEATKAENERILQMNRENLEAMEQKKDDKIKEIYSQMKDSAIASVLNEMDANEAKDVILSLESRKISSVLAKMEPAKASELTLLIKKSNENNASTLSGGAGGLNGLNGSGTAGSNSAGANAVSKATNTENAAANAITTLNDPNNRTSSQDNGEK